MTVRIPLLRQELEALAPIDPEAMPIAEARRRWKAYRIANGMKGAASFLAEGEANAKLALSGIPTRSLTLAPWTASGVANVCESATRGCREVCVLKTSGRARYPSVMQGRISRTGFLTADPQAAVTLIAAELAKASATIAGRFLVRLNVASDIPWEHIAPAVFDAAGDRAGFYDYTKLHPDRRSPNERYRIVYSVSEAAHSIPTAMDYISRGGSAAVVFNTPKGEPLPVSWRGVPVIDGDLSDDRTADPAGVIVGLRAKGAARGMPAGGFIQSATANA